MLTLEALAVFVFGFVYHALYALLHGRTPEIQHQPNTFPGHLQICQALRPEQRIFCCGKSLAFNHDGIVNKHLNTFRMLCISNAHSLICHDNRHLPFASNSAQPQFNGKRRLVDLLFQAWPKSFVHFYR